MPDTIFRSSGYDDGEFPDSRREANGSSIDELWRIKELLSAKELAEEGKHMGHCVYAYASRIERGDASIWSVRMTDDRTDDRRILTMEVRNDLKRVVQVRGRFNRPPSTKELQVIATWADRNRLEAHLEREGAPRARPHAVRINSGAWLQTRGESSAHVAPRQC